MKVHNKSSYLTALPNVKVHHKSSYLIALPHVKVHHKSSSAHHHVPRLFDEGQAEDNDNDNCIKQYNVALIKTTDVLN